MNTTEIIKAVCAMSTDQLDDWYEQTVGYRLSKDDPTIIGTPRHPQRVGEMMYLNGHGDDGGYEIFRQALAAATGDTLEPAPIVEPPAPEAPKPDTLERLAALLLEVLRPQLQVMVDEAVESALGEFDDHIADEVKDQLSGIEEQIEEEVGHAIDLMTNSHDFTEAVQDVVREMSFYISVER